MTGIKRQKGMRRILWVCLYMFYADRLHTYKSKYSPVLDEKKTRHFLTGLFI